MNQTRPPKGSSGAKRIITASKRSSGTFHLIVFFSLFSHIFVLFIPFIPKNSNYFYDFYFYFFYLIFMSFYTPIFFNTFFWTFVCAANEDDERDGLDIQSLSVVEAEFFFNKTDEGKSPADLAATKRTINLDAFHIIKVIGKGKSVRNFDILLFLP